LMFVLVLIVLETVMSAPQDQVKTDVPGGNGKMKFEMDLKETTGHEQHD